MKKILALILALLFLVGCATTTTTDTTKTTEDTKTTESTTTETTKLKVGLTGSDSKVWKHVAEVVKEKGIELELVYFDSYPLPNAALNAGEIDLNAFQHYAYLNKEIEENGYSITPIADTVIAPLGIYSKELKDITTIADGSSIAIPDDPTNGGRALKLLEAAGLIKVNPEAGILPTIKDITENPKNLQIQELAATNIPPVLDELPAAVINSGVAVTAGLTPSKDAIVLEDYDLNAAEKSPYINVIAVKTERKDEEVFKTIIEAYQTDEVKKIIEEDSQGSSIPVWK